jgi:TusA-related sulfurtransferase
MANTLETDVIPEPGLFLDISGEVCPLTFVRTKLLIERMKPGQAAEIRLKGPEPLANVPRAVTGLGHSVLALVPEDPTAGPHAVHRLTIRKARP